MKHVDQLTRELNDRRARREQESETFFDTEKEVCAEMHERIQKELGIVESHTFINNTRVRICQSTLEDPELFDRLLKLDALALDEREAYDIPSHYTRFQMQDAEAASYPRTSSTGKARLRHVLNARILFLNTNLNYLELMGEILHKEVHLIGGFEKHRPGYEAAVAKFHESVKALHRQRAFQRELDERLARLHFLREARIKGLTEELTRIIKEQKEEEEQIRIAKERAGPTLTKRFATRVKKQIRGVKDFVYKMQQSASTSLNAEEERMAKKLRSHEDETAATHIEGIRRFFITQGPEEEAAFKIQNDLLISKGLPSYRRMEQSIGMQVFIWAQITTSIRDFITSIEIAHRDRNNPLYRDLSKEGYEPTGHAKLEFVIWTKIDESKNKGYNTMAVSFSEIEENRMVVDGLIKLCEEPMDNFSMPFSFLWARRVNKTETEDVGNTSILAADVVRLRQMIKDNPGDGNLKFQLRDLKAKLEQAYKRDKAYEDKNPMERAVELMALDEDEIEAWLQIFRRFDKKKTGYISMIDIYDGFDINNSAFTNFVFESSDAFTPNTAGLIECGDFMFTIGTYAFFGKDDILSMLYNFADTDKKGHITHSQFVDLLNILNPGDKRRAKRALAEMDLTPDKIMDFKEFTAIHNKFPQIMYPAFQLQASFREKTFGYDWWVNKLRTYKGVRKKILNIDRESDSIAMREMERYNEDQEKQKRMKERAYLIDSEGSQIRKTLLQARQFLDEFS
jgi:Ca2+-binding EF-hand superfamily protein